MNDKWIVLHERIYDELSEILINKKAITCVHQNNHVNYKTCIYIIDRGYVYVEEGYDEIVRLLR